MIWRRLLRVVKAEPTAEERAAAMKAEHAANKKTAAEAWEEQQRQEHLAWIAAAVAETERQRRLAEANGAWMPEDEGRGGLAEITLREGEWVSLDAPRRRRRFW
jgi:hypothetical protein